MSEKHTTPSYDSHEQNKSHEQHGSGETHLQHAEQRTKSTAEHPTQNIENIRDAIEKQAVTTEKHSAHRETTHTAKEPNTFWFNKEYKALAFKQTMTTVRRHLSPTEKRVSKFVHQPMVERASEIASTTVARPSGVLMGGIFSFLASLITYVIARRYGYDFNYGVFSIAFLGGFVLGVAVEYLYRFLRAVFSRY